MLLIIEGPDGVGKSTLVEQLVATLEREEPGSKIEVLRKRPPKVHPLDEYVTPLLSYRPGREHHIICDRWHVGEWVYPDVFQRKTLATKAMWWYTEMFLHSRGALVVYPQSDVDTLVKRITSRGDDMVEVHQLAKIFAGYRYMMEQHLLPVWNQPTDDPSAVITRAAFRDRMARRLNDYTTYVGPPRPERLLVGDVRNAVTGPEDLHPAFVPYRGTSGHYLLSNLRPEQFKGLGIMNACDVDDALVAQYFTFEDVPTVTLGSHARARMNGTGVAIPSVPHPQYVRRFHHRAGDQYAAAIQRALDGEEMIAWRPTTSA